MPRKGPDGAYRYRSIAADILTRIEAGHWLLGERLPSVRQLMQEQGASMSTIVRALLSLESAGRIRSVPRSGWRVAQAPLPDTGMSWYTSTTGVASDVSINRLVVQLLSSVSDGSMLSMGTTAIDQSLLPLKALKRALLAVARQPGELALSASLSPLGDHGLRVQIAKLMATRGVRVTPDEVVITSGDGVSLEVALQLIAPPGSVVAVESPAYFGTLQALENLGLKAIEIATDSRTGIDLTVLAEALQRHPIRALVVTPTCQNPFGSLMPPDAKAGLLALAEQHDLAIIEDDLYGELYYRDPRPAALKANDSSRRVIYCSSLSRTLSPGWRIGWMIPARWRDRFLEQKIVRANSASSLPQVVLAHYLSGRGAMRHLADLRAIFYAQMPRVRSLIAAHFPPGTRVTEPQGGYVFWIELPPHINAIALAEAAFRQGISIAPGPIFSATQGFQNCIRLSIGTVLTPRIEEGIAVLGALASGTA